MIVFKKLLILVEVNQSQNADIHSVDVIIQRIVWKK